MNKEHFSTPHLKNFMLQGLVCATPWKDPTRLLVSLHCQGHVIKLLVQGKKNTVYNNISK